MTVEKHIFGKPFYIDSVINFPPYGKTFTDEPKNFPVGKIDIQDDFKFTCKMNEDDMIFGLGEAMGGINKRGRIYKSWCNDDPHHTEEKESLYGAHNFLVVYSPSIQKAFGLYFDYPGMLEIDAGFTKIDELVVHSEKTDIAVYFIADDSASPDSVVKSIVSEFRKMIGQSYIAPFWAMGFMQSRWGYGSEQDLVRVYENHKKHNLPLDAIFLDIDYMDEFKDFTVNKENLPNFAAAVKKMNDKNIHVVPIIDAGIKADDTFDVDVEGVKNDFYCKKADGSLLAAAVWPNLSHFPDFLNSDARRWFGEKYKILLDAGVDGFWNDMNEPALFYSEDGIKEAANKLIELSNKVLSDDNTQDKISWQMSDTIWNVKNAMKDYASFYHTVDEKEAGNFAVSVKNGKATVCHKDVHNLYGFNMTKAASEYFDSIGKKSDILLFSRASFIGAHRYGGVWTGDNNSWWSHILLCLKMLPSLNMCGFLYTGCDLGGFGCNTNRELLLRFLALGVFTPLMRNHSALGTREQECYNFENTEDFAGILNLRYRLIPYLYDQYKKASENNTMYFRPLAFDYPTDKIALRIEDQLMLGEDLMIAPIYEANAKGRFVYLPEEMYCLRSSHNHGSEEGIIPQELLKAGTHFVECAPNEVVFFVKKTSRIPLVDAAENTKSLDLNKVTFVGAV